MVHQSAVRKRAPILFAPDRRSFFLGSVNGVIDLRAHLGAPLRERGGVRQLIALDQLLCALKRVAGEIFLPVFRRDIDRVVMFAITGRPQRLRDHELRRAATTNASPSAPADFGT